VNRGALAALVIGAGLAGAVGYAWFSARESQPVVATPAAPPAASAPEAPAARLVDTVPEFQLADREGQLRSLAHWQGKSLIVNFWATWCAPCRREIPLLQQIARDHRAAGVEVIGIAVDFRDAVLEYADEMKIEYPLLIGEQDALDAAAAFGVEAIGFPFTIFTDQQGRIIVAHMGELTAPEADLILKAVAAVNAGRESPAEARRTIEAALSALQQESDGKSAG
jgi:thiol-disulfide isomerase/thioredoxin